MIKRARAHPRSIDGIFIPEAVLSLIPLEDREKDVQEKFAEIGNILRKKRDEAMEDRQSSGIEEVWTLCEDAYAGIDDLNRHEFNANRWIKPTTLNAPVTTANDPKARGKRSTAFVRLTSRYVDAGCAKVSEILLPPNDKAFSFEPTPVPDLVGEKLQGAASSHDQATTDKGDLLWRDPRPDELALAVPYGNAELLPTPKPTAPPTAGGEGQPITTANQGKPPHKVPLTQQDLALLKKNVARDRAKRAETRIWDWMTECSHIREMRKVIFDSAKLGTGILKGPYPEFKRHVGVTKDADGKLVVSILEELVPADKWVDVWNIFPAPGCGEIIRNGDYLFEREFVSQKQLEDLKGLPGYINSQIDLAIASGPTVNTQRSRNPNERENRFQYELWYYYGVLRQSDFAALNPKAARDNTNERAFVIVTLVGDTPIRASLNPLSATGHIPYMNVVWQRRSGYWAGTGIAEQLFVPQRIVNASTRALLNNAGISAGPQVVVNREGISPADGEWDITPNKIWYASNDGVIDDVRKAFVSFDITNVERPLSNIIQYGMRLAEESTSIPLITQGQSGATTPDTFGAAQLQNNNANQLLRSIGYRYDDDVTEPLVTMYYEYLLLDPKIPNEEKGDFKIYAHGSVALVERAIHDQFLLQMSPFTSNPAYGVNPKRWFALIARSKHLDPADVQYTAEEQAILDSKPIPPPYQVQVAQINAEVKKQQWQVDMKIAQDELALEREIAHLEQQTDQAIAEMTNRTLQLKAKLDTDRDTVYVRAEMEKIQSTHVGRMEELKLKKELAVMEYAAKHQLSLEQVKAKLADTAMKLKAQQQLAEADRKLAIYEHQSPSASDLMKPPAQSPGKAANGNSFSQV